MLVGQNWHRLLHVELHGFYGLALGMLMVAAIPIFITSLIIVLRTKKPLITLSAPKILKDIFKTVPTTPDGQTTATETNVPSPGPEKFPDNMPAELHAAFVNARMNKMPFRQSAFNRGNMIAPPPRSVQKNESLQRSTPNTLPLPTDFDTPTPAPDKSDDIPVFSEINFDDFDDNTNITPPDETTITKVIKKLETMGYTAKQQDDIIVCDDMAIAVHDDSDFWVADSENWFAAGKQKPSPIMKLQNIYAPMGKKLVLYLMTDNIMDIDALRQEWEKSGIIVISDLNNLPK